MNLELIFLMLLSHFLADTGLQNRMVAEGKRKHWQMMVTHSLCSTSLIGIIGYFMIGFPSILIPWFLCFISHFIYDSCKCRLHLWNSMWLDQFLHVITIIIVFAWR